METITPFELKKLMDWGDVELIDVRPKKDFEKIHAWTACSIPLSTFEPHAVLAHRKLDRHAPLYLICRRKTLATLAACGLAGAGLDEAIVVEGGFEAWEEQGLPVVRRANLWQRPGRPQEARHIELGHCFASVRRIIAAACIAGFLAFSGATALPAGHADTPSKPLLAVSGPAKLARTATEVERGPRGKSQIAITFDAGANAECFEDLIAALERARVHSTFFITGNWAQRNMDCAKAITKHGHEVGNHTWNHLALTKYSDDIVHEEITRAENLLSEISGQSPRPRWRAPFGARDDRVLRIAANLGYRSIYWTIDSLDSVEPRKTSEFLVERITSKTDGELDGAIILMHVGEKSTADALPAIIANLQARGFRLVTISKLLESTVKTP